WVQVSGGTYRVNRRLTLVVGDGRVTFTNIGATVRVIPQELRELPMLRGFDDLESLRALADRFTQREYRAGEVIIEAGSAADEVLVIAHGRVEVLQAGGYGHDNVLRVLADGDHYGSVLEDGGQWDVTLRAESDCIVLSLSHRDFEQSVESNAPLF